MKKIVVITVDIPISSKDAYRIAELADTASAEIIFLFIVDADHYNCYERGNFAIGLLEEAAQNYEFGLYGDIRQGDPSQIVRGAAKKWDVDLIVVCGDETTGSKNYDDLLGMRLDCPIELLNDAYSRVVFE